MALWKSGRLLVREDAFDKVPWGVVLAGESRDSERADAAIRLFREGRIDTLVLSAMRTFRDRYQSELQLDHYLEQGVPRGRIFEFRHEAASTQEEAGMLVRQFRLQNLDTVLIITSNYHTARTRRIFRKLAQGYPVILVSSAEYHVFDPDAWWSNRESRKVWLLEWAKTFFTFFELAFTEPESGRAPFQGLIPDIWSADPDSAGAAEPEPMATFSLGESDSAEAGDSVFADSGAASDSLDTLADSASVSAAGVRSGAADSVAGEVQGEDGAGVESKEKEKEPARKAPRAPRIVPDKAAAPVKASKETAKKAASKAKAPAKPSVKKTGKPETRKKNN